MEDCIMIPPKNCLQHDFSYFADPDNDVRFNLEKKIENALPEGFVKDVFCAQHRAGQEESTCPGDSGK